MKESERIYRMLGELAPAKEEMPGGGCTDSGEETLKKKLKQLTFVLIELELFLDTHPTDQEAIACYQARKAEWEQLKMAWEEEHGDISGEGVKRWSRVDLPWPWQKEA